MRYDRYLYLWPPRPEVKAPREMIGFYARRGWTAQVKKNGTCTVIFARAGEVIFKTRHNDDHKHWQPSDAHRALFQCADWNVFVGELLHSKGPQVKNHLYLFDQLVHDGETLTGVSYEGRYALLEKRFPGRAAPSAAGLGAIAVGPLLSRARCFAGSGAAELWDQLTGLDEGLVFKNPKAPLASCVTATSNASWQAKIRLPHANFSF